MKNKKIRIFAALLAVMLCMAAFPLTAYAGGGEDSEAEATAEPVTEPEAANPNPVSLTPDGNLALVDDIESEQAEDKQFITVVTKNGNYFYIIIDRAGDTENVYFLNLVDEADLSALIEEMDTAPTTVITPEPEPTEPEPAAEPEPEEKSGSMGGILIVLLVIAAAGGGTFYYFKILKPKQAVQGGTDLDELEELDFDDDYSDLGAEEQEDEE